MQVLLKAGTGDIVKVKVHRTLHRIKGAADTFWRFGSSWGCYVLVGCPSGGSVPPLTKRRVSDLWVLIGGFGTGHRD